MRPKSIVITGANGMLGSSLCRMYNEEYQIFAFHRDKECLTDCSVDYSLDLTDTCKVSKLFNQINPDLVIHCAGLTNIDKCENDRDLAREMNVLATENLVKSCSIDTRIIYISTDQVYGETNDNSETNINLQPVNQYGVTKLLGEQKVQEQYKNYIIIRTNIFGWNVKSNRVSSAEWIYNSLIQNKNITLFTDYKFSPIFTEDLGNIIMQLVNLDYNGTINIGSSNSCSKYEFGHEMAEKLNCSKEYLDKGSIFDCNLSAQRMTNLSFNLNRLNSIQIYPPTYQESIKSFLNNITI